MKFFLLFFSFYRRTKKKNNHKTKIYVCVVRKVESPLEVLGGSVRTSHLSLHLSLCLSRSLWSVDWEHVILFAFPDLMPIFLLVLLFFPTEGTLGGSVRPAQGLIWNQNRFVEQLPFFEIKCGSIKTDKLSEPELQLLNLLPTQNFQDYPTELRTKYIREPSLFML